MIVSPHDRIGVNAIAVDPDRIVGIVESDQPDNTGPNAPEVRLCYSSRLQTETDQCLQNEESRAIAGHLINFLSEEVAAHRLPRSLLPLQSGIGNVANSIIGKSSFPIGCGS